VNFVKFRELFLIIFDAVRKTNAPFNTVLKMKKIALLLILPFLGVAQSSNSLIEKNGFKDYIFGTAPHQYKDLTLEIEEGNAQLYSLAKAPIQMDGAEFEYVRVTFLKNKLSAISLQTKNSTGPKFLAVLKQNYGEPAKSPKKNSYIWETAKMQLLYETYGTDATISFYSSELYKNGR
jgi:hypothetical protein